eukprot:Nk52_evm3s265 gene=Nk52_evmTU3s265
MSIDVSQGGAVTKRSGKKPKRDGTKRMNHNLLERKRRDHIKNCFDELRDSCPIINHDNPSRSQILKKACEYIHFMLKKNAKTESEINELKVQGSRL